MRRRLHTARSLHRAARAARCLAGDDVAAVILIRALCRPPAPGNDARDAVGVGLLPAHLAAEHGLTPDELLALGPDDLIDLLWPDQPERGAGTGASQP